MADSTGPSAGSGANPVSGDWRPIPDPSVLTTEQLRRELSSLRELLEVRLNGMDQAVRLAAGNLEKVRDQIRLDSDQRIRSEREFTLGQIRIAQAETARVGDVAQEKFAAIDGTFQSNALALTAALAAQKEAAAEQNKSNTLAITKSEQATKETISSNAAQTQTGIAALATTLADLKERIVRIETGGAVAATNRTDRRLDFGQILTAVAVAVAVIGLVAALLAKP